MLLPLMPFLHLTAQIRARQRSRNRMVAQQLAANHARRTAADRAHQATLVFARGGQRCVRIVCAVGVEWSSVTGLLVLVLGTWRVARWRWWRLVGGVVVVVTVGLAVGTAVVLESHCQGMALSESITLADRGMVRIVGSSDCRDTGFAADKVGLRRMPVKRIAWGIRLVDTIGLEPRIAGRGRRCRRCIYQPWSCSCARKYSLGRFRESLKLMKPEAV
ncbi:uncharacterized protein CC84DRAFT_864782 [Paraphaeosphaeria sporulosa]|uniref:Uncharacterized protein n=1 Tax=Paraphaeosphaeria sporulosa TaxID=1460663 RepID=A0A177C8J1_9PLEO|nr:uncharacterized protein CC84DRAFT_864782 [Paraphaeosphaeria sporulosa]OAG03716.1 hypothetical protein CC84DRAFT_864782 [Paraphaeosphaeria sporulosa]